MSTQRDYMNEYRREMRRCLLWAVGSLVLVTGLAGAFFWTREDWAWNLLMGYSLGTVVGRMTSPRASIVDRARATS